jgi:hypothetical protein
VVTLFFALLAFAGAQQFVRGTATGSPVGIFVHLGPRIASRERPSDDVVAYRLERRVFGQKDWTIVTDVSAPGSLDELQSAFDDIATFVPGVDRVPGPVAETLWQRAERKRMVDSLGFWGSNIQVRVAFGAMYLDRTALRDTDYEYRISELDTTGTTRFWALSDSMHWPLAVSFAPVKLDWKHATRKEVSVRWSAVGEKIQLSMVVYRRSGGVGDFQLVRPVRYFSRSHDTVFYHLRDTTVEPLRFYEYYIKSMCPYGNTGAPSETAGIGTYRFVEVPPPESIVVRSQDSLPGIIMSWHVPETGPVKSVRVYRSADYDTGYKQLAELPPAARFFEDASAEEAVRYFYTLEMTGWLGEVSPRTARTFGTFMSALDPSAPFGLAGVGTTKGVRLTWEWNFEPVAGFYVFRANSTRDSLRRVSGLLPFAGAQMAFEDTAPELEPYYDYLYSVQTESKSFRHSALVETVFVRPAKPTNPAAPLDLEATVRDAAVRLFWADMRTLVRALAGYLVSRRELDSLGDGAAFTRLNDSLSLVPEMANSYVDTTARPGHVYQYAVQCRDLHGGVSPLSTPALVVFSVSPLAAPAGLSAWRTDEGIVLRWSEPIQDGVSGYRLYRHYESAEPVVVARLGRDKSEFTDTEVRSDRLYHYYVTCISPDGRESAPGERVSIRY